MKMERPPIPTYDNVKKYSRTGRDTLCYEFYCQECGSVFGSCNDTGARDYTMKRLQTTACESCGAMGENWACREVSD